MRALAGAPPCPAQSTQNEPRSVPEGMQARHSSEDHGAQAQRSLTGSDFVVRRQRLSLRLRRDDTNGEDYRCLKGAYISHADRRQAQRRHNTHAAPESQESARPARQGRLRSLMRSLCARRASSRKHSGGLAMLRAGAMVPAADDGRGTNTSSMEFRSSAYAPRGELHIFGSSG